MTGIGALFAALLIQLSGSISIAGAEPNLIGDGVQRASEKDHPALCRIDILIDTGNGEIEFLCSGSLISENTVLTSAHCFPLERDYSATVTCGEKFMGGVRDVQVPDASTWIDSEHPAPTRDYAIVNTRRKSRAEPLPLARSPEAWFDDNGLLRPGITCRIAGFGKDHRGSTGHLLIGSPKEVEFILEDRLIHMIPVSEWLKTSANPGDSGGPLLCQGPGMKEEIVGITHAFRFLDDQDQRIDNLFVPTWNLP